MTIFTKIPSNLLKPPVLIMSSSFVDNDLKIVQKDLEDAGAPMPAFQRIGGLLSGSRDAEGKPLRKVIESVDQAIAREVRIF